jgi:capsular exopolysaccharide synthesis family protein
VLPLTSERNQELDLRHAIGVLRQRGLAIAVLCLASVFCALVLSSRSAELYQSTASVRISNPNSENLFQSVQVPIDLRRQVETETHVLQSHDLRSLVDQQLGARAGQIQRVTVTNPENTDLLNITAVSTSPQIAREAADTYADVYVQRRKERAASELDRRADELRNEANRLGDEMLALDDQIDEAEEEADAETLRSRKAALQDQQSTASNLAFQLGAQAALASGAVEVANRGQLPDRPISPTPTRDAALAGVVALGLGVGGALLLDRLDDRIMGPDDLEVAAPGVPVLASVPIYAPNRKRGAAKLPHGPRRLVPLNSVDAEVYRTLRSNVRYGNIERTKNVLMVTSASGSEGKSTVTANLAVALAENSQRVVVVSADLRRPTLASLFGVDETARGLTSVLRGEERLPDCMVPVTLESGRRLYVLPAGPIPHNPAELLGSHLMGKLLDELTNSDVDYVLLDCPPVLPVSDPLAVAQYVDGVIMLVAVGETRMHTLHEACDRLQKVGASVLGIVLNGVPTARGRYPYYYYRRYDRYGYVPGDGRSRRGAGGGRQPEPVAGNGKPNGSRGERPLVIEADPGGHG